MRKLTKKQYRRYGGDKHKLTVMRELDHFCNSRYDDDRQYIELIRQKLDKQYLPSWDSVES